MKKLQILLTDLTITPLEIRKVKEELKNFHFDYSMIFEESEINKEDTVIKIIDDGKLEVEEKSNEGQHVYIVSMCLFNSLLKTIEKE